jgi:P27 family predicted phage terminase small subunit
MGRGRPRKSPEELKLAGTFGQHSSRQKWNARNATPLTEKAAPSRYLKRTQYFWNQFMIEKAQQNVLSVADEPVFVAMFDSYDQWLRYKDKREKLTIGYETMEEINIRNRLDCMIDREFKQWTSLAIRFGITPTERSKLECGPEQKETEFMQILKRAKA